MERLVATELLDDPSLADEIVARAYRDIARTHDWLGNTAAILRLRREGPRPVRRVLDLGCGQGALLEVIRRDLGVDVLGVDLRRAPASAPVPIRLGDAVRDPLPKADVALAV